jgi:hypothetical protein
MPWHIIRYRFWQASIGQEVIGHWSVVAPTGEDAVKSMKAGYPDWVSIEYVATPPSF